MRCLAVIKRCWPQRRCLRATFQPPRAAGRIVAGACRGECAKRPPYSCPPPLEGALACRGRSRPGRSSRAPVTPAGAGAWRLGRNAVPAALVGATEG